MKAFEFILPNGSKYKIKYSDEDNKIDIVNKILQEECFNIPEEEENFYIENNIPLPKTWEDYLNGCWIYFGKTDPNKLNFEDKTKLMLNALAAFLDDSSIRDKWNRKEFPYDFLNNNNNKKKYKKSNSNVNNVLLGIQKDQETYDSKNKMNIRRYKKSKTYRFLKIFSKKDIKINELYKLKNKDVCSEQEIKIIKEHKNFSEEDLVKWLNKPLKNVFNQNVYNNKEKVYGGWKGIVDINKPYFSKWCYVNSVGEFIFSKTVKKEILINNIKCHVDCIINTKYKIDIDNVPQYQDIRKDKYYKNESGWSMDNIFCVEQDNKIYFWDMNIEKIDNRFIYKSK